MGYDPKGRAFVVFGKKDDEGRVQTQQKRKELDVTEKQNTEICGNKMPTRCNRGFIADLIACSTCFGAPLCPSSGAQKY